MFVDHLRQDLRYAVRSYAKSPSYALIMLITLALGIGASTAIFSMVNGILLRPLPLPDPDRLLFATEINVIDKSRAISTSVPNYVDWRARARSFEALALSNDAPQTLTGVDQARRIRARRITGNFFRTVGVAPAIGRDFTDDDDRPNTAAAVILSDGFWKTHVRRRAVRPRTHRDAERHPLHGRRGHAARLRIPAAVRRVRLDGAGRRLADGAVARQSQRIRRGRTVEAAASPSTRRRANSPRSRRSWNGSIRRPIPGSART